MNIDNLLSFFPRIKKVDPHAQEPLFSIIDQAPLSSDTLQISFERKPDFFQYLRLQGQVGFAFYFTNQDGTPQGFAVSTFRQMKLRNKSICLGYTSDLRTTSRLDRVARLEWRRFYAKAVETSYEIEEFQKCSGFLTAVWDDNQLAQKALVQKKRPQDIGYFPVASYESHALWGRWFPLFRPRVQVRKIKEIEIPTLIKTLCDSSGLAWMRSDLESTLSQLGASLSDFYVLEKKSEVSAFVLLTSTDQMKQTIIKKWPNSLNWSAKLLPLFRKRAIQLNRPLTISQLMFFRSVNNNPHDLYDFVDYFWYENSKKFLCDQFHLLTTGVWSNYQFKKKGYLVSSISGTLYKVQTDRIRPEFQEISDFSCLEVGLL